MLKNIVSNISNKIKIFSAGFNDNSINKVPSLYKDYILVKINLPYKARWKQDGSIIKHIKNALGGVENDQILNNYLDSREYKMAVKELYGVMSHPKVLKIDRVEGNEYVYHTINYTNSPKDIKIGKEIVKTQEIGTYVKGGKIITHYFVNVIYEGRMTIDDFNKNVKPLSLSEKKILGGYENMEKAVSLISKNTIPIINIDKYTTDKFVLHAVQYKAHNKLEDIYISNKSVGGYSEPEL